MSPLVLFVLGVAGGLCLVAHLGLFLAAYAPVRRRARAWTANPPSMVAFQENNLGIDPDAAYLYAAFDVGTDDALVVRGRLDPVSPYASMTLYDPYLQGFPGRTGPTHLNHRDLVLSPEGQFELVLAHRDPGAGPWLDLAGRRRGLVAWRQAEGHVEPPLLTSRTLAPVPEPGSSPGRLTGPWSWGWVRAIYVGWMTLRTIRGGDYVFTLGAGQDAADFDRFETLGAHLDRDHSGRRLRLQARPAPRFDMHRPYAEGSLGAHVRDHFSGPAEQVELAPTGFPLSPRGTWAKERWRHTHDLRHVLLGLGTSLPEEVVLHAFQLGQFATWSGGLIVFFGGLLSLLQGAALRPLIGGVRAAYGGGRRARLVVAEPVEDFVDWPIEAVRRRLGIVPMGQLYGAQGPYPPAPREKARR